jgi:hypothetical protein
MVRIGLSLYLMLVAAAGPWLCCCKTQRLLAPLLTFPPKESSHAGCCGDHQAAKHSQKHGTPEQRSGDQEQPGRPSCPCQEDGSRQLVAVDPEMGRQVQSRYSLQGQIEPLFALPTLLSLSPDGDRQLPSKGEIRPFLTAQDILCALHILRC